MGMELVLVALAAGTDSSPSPCAWVCRKAVVFVLCFFVYSPAFWGGFLVFFGVRGVGIRRRS